MLALSPELSLYFRLMYRLLGPHPAIIALMLLGGGFLLFFFGYDILFVDPSARLPHEKPVFSITWQWTLMILGAVIWLAGGIYMGRALGIRWHVALLIHLVPVIGVIVLRIIGKPVSPHDAWARDNRGYDAKEARRTYRPMKPLY